MAAVTPPTDVRINSDSLNVRPVPYGDTVAFGSALYLAADNTYKLADANNSILEAQLSAIAVTPGGSGGHGIVAFDGDLSFSGSTFTVGETYFVGRTPGSLIPRADLASGDWVQRVGTAITTATLRLSIEIVGVQYP
jgi:hypothetical protein